MIDIEKKDMILMYLEGLEEFREEEEVPYDVTPKGITDSIELEEDRPYHTLEEMESEGLLMEDERFISNLDRKRNVYFLTDEGKRKEEEVWNRIKDQQVTIKTENKEKILSLKNIENHISGRNPTIKGLKTIDENGVIDLTCLEEDTEVFVGRKEELDRLKTELNKAKKSGARTVMVEGEAGVGKTSLVSKLVPFAEELGFEFLSGTCQGETSDPYLPFKEAFNEYMESNEQTGEKGMSFIGTIQQEEKIDDESMFDAKKKETFYQTTKTVKQIAGNDPLVVFLDDLQWVDRATLDILAYMDEKLEDASVLFIGTYRPEDVSEKHHLVEMIHRMDLEDRIKRIELQPLDYQDTEETIKNVLGSEEIPQYLIERIHDKTEGNPLFIKESLKQMIQEDIIDPENHRYPEESDEISISRLVHDVIERRIDRLDEDTRKIIQIGSVIGGKIPFDLLSGTADMDEIDLLDYIDILKTNDLWEPHPKDDAFHFCHTMIEDTVYENLDRLKRKLLHKKIAQNLEELYKDELEDWYSDLARHYEAGGENSEALEYFVKAGKNAEKVYANDDAIEMYERALELFDGKVDLDIDKLGIIEKIAGAYSLMGEYEKAREHLEQALGLTEKGKETQCIHRKITETHHEQGNREKALEHIEEGLSAYGKENSEKCKLLSLKGWTYLHKGNFDRAEEIFKDEKKIAEKIESEKQRGQVYHDLGTTALRKGDLDEGIEKLKRAIEIREKIDDKIELQKSYNNIGGAYVYKGNLEEGEKFFKKSLQVCEEIGHKNGISSSFHNLGDIHRRRGDLTKSIETYRKSLDISHKIGDIHGEANTHTDLAELYLMKGDLGSSRKNLEESIEIKEKTGDKYWTSANLIVLANLKIKESNLDEAEEKIRDSMKIAKEIGSQRQLAITNYEIGKIYTLKGEFEKAKEHLDKSIEFADKIGIKEKIAESKDILGKIHRSKGNIEKAKKIRKEGLKLAERAKEEKAKIINKIGLGEIHLEAEELEKVEECLTKVSEKIQDREEPRIIIRHLMLKGKLKIKRGNINEAEQYLKKSLKRCRGAEDKIKEAKTLYELGNLKLEKEEKKDAKDYIQGALKSFEDMDMSLWEKRTREQLDKVL